MLRADCDAGVGEKRDRQVKVENVTPETSFNDTSYEDSPVIVQVWMMAHLLNTVKVVS